MRYIQGVNRNQTLRLPETLDEYVSPENPVRVIDAFVDDLDLEDLGFGHAPPKALGRKPYNPADLLNSAKSAISSAKNWSASTAPKSTPSITAAASMITPSFGVSWNRSMSGSKTICMP